jgi:hypothetical protein
MPRLDVLVDPYLESSGKREPTAIPVGSTRDQKRLARLAAEAHYHWRMVDDGSPSPDSDAKAAIFFGEWATRYDDNVIAHHRGREREREILRTLRAGFSYNEDGTLRILREIDRELVIEWRTERRSRSKVVEHRRTVISTAASVACATASLPVGRSRNVCSYDTEDAWSRRRCFLAPLESRIQEHATTILRHARVNVLPCATHLPELYRGRHTPVADGEQRRPAPP